MNGNDNKTKSLFTQLIPNTVSEEDQLRCMGCMETFSSEFEICPHCGYVVNTHPRLKCYLHPGSWLAGNYMLGRVIGQGGFGITYIAWDKKEERKVAIKEFFPNSLSTRETGETHVGCYNEKAEVYFKDGVKKMIDEGRRLASFRENENIVTVYDYFEENSTAYIVMEYLEGKSLKDYAEEKGGRLDPDEAVTLMLPVLNALSAMHKENLIHRDVAPDNIYLCDDGRIKLLDFGSARIAVQDANKSLSVMVKPGYAPKEQYASRSKQGPWTDVYSVCATLYRLITGEAPVESIERDITPLKTIGSFGVVCSETLKKIIYAGLEPEPKDRFSSAEELATYLKEDYLENNEYNSVGIRPDSVEARSSLTYTSKKQKNLIIGAVVFLIIILLFVIVLFGVISENNSAADNVTDSQEVTEKQTLYSFETEYEPTFAVDTEGHTHTVAPYYDEFMNETEHQFTERASITSSVVKRTTQKSATTRKQITSTRKQTSATTKKQKPTGLTLSSNSGSIHKGTNLILATPSSWSTKPGETRKLSVSINDLGYSLEFDATVSPSTITGDSLSATVIVFSGNTSVATASVIKNGNTNKVTVTAQGAGTTKITVKCKEDQSISAVYTVTVTEDEVYYSSDNPSVVSVTSDGVMTAHSPGKAKIKITSGTETDSCSVTVEEPTTKASTTKKSTTRASTTKASTAKATTTKKSTVKESTTGKNVWEIYSEAFPQESTTANLYEDFSAEIYTDNIGYTGYFG